VNVYLNCTIKYALYALGKYEKKILNTVIGPVNGTERTSIEIYIELCLLTIINSQSMSWKSKYCSFVNSTRWLSNMRHHRRQFLNGSIELIASMLLSAITCLSTIPMAIGNNENKVLFICLLLFRYHNVKHIVLLNNWRACRYIHAIINIALFYWHLFQLQCGVVCIVSISCHWMRDRIKETWSYKIYIFSTFFQYLMICARYNHLDMIWYYSIFDFIISRTNQSLFFLRKKKYIYSHLYGFLIDYNKTKSNS
jgi:hypothetical protein